MPTFFDLASEFYGMGRGLMVTIPTRINLLDGSNLFYINRETGEFDLLDGSPRRNRPREFDDDSIDLGWSTPMKSDRVDSIVVLSEATYHIVKRNRAKAGEVLKRVVGEDGMVFFLVPKIRSCDQNRDNCLARDRSKKPVECQFVFPRSSSKKAHMYCEYDDIILYRLYKELKSDAFGKFSIWGSNLDYAPSVRIVSGDTRLRQGASRNWLEVLGQLLKLGQTLEIDIIALNRE
eukprot:2326991-Prymnesium_polylepis.1